MEVDADDDLLRTLAAGGSIDNALWPRTLSSLVSRIESNCYTGFPIPIIPPPRRTQSIFPDWDSADPAGLASSSDDAPAPSSSLPPEDIDKENAEPAPPAGAVAQDTEKETEDAASSTDSGDSGGSGAKDKGKGNGSVEDGTPAEPVPASGDDAAASTAMPPPPVPAAPSSPSPSASAPASPSTADAPTMPQPAVELLAYITSHLTTTFPKYPPHSIQRLAELALFPHQHYRYLGPYLSALERVVSVTSGCNHYPLPSELPPTQAAILNGTAAFSAAPGRANGAGPASARHSTAAAAAAGADAAQEWSGDASWGALLTPIPWLRGQQPNNSSAAADDDRSTTEEAAAGGGDGGGSSPLDGSSSDDGSEIAFSTTSSTAGGASPSPSSLNNVRDDVSGARDAHSHSPSPSPSPSPLPSSSSHGAASPQQQQQQQQQQQPPFQHLPQGQPPPQQQRRLEVRTEATETIDGPNGVGSIETVSVSINGIHSHGGGAAAHHGRPPFADDEPGPADDTAMGGTAGDAHGAADDANDEDEIPHARGPQELGAADMGPQRGSSSTSAPGLQIGSAADASAVHTVNVDEMDLESAVGRPADKLPAGAVAAPLIPSIATDTLDTSDPSDPPDPSSVVASTEAVDEADAAAASTAPAASSALAPARAATPKREADQSLLDDALPAKKRKADSSSSSSSSEGDGTAAARGGQDDQGDKVATDAGADAGAAPSPDGGSASASASGPETGTDGAGREKP